MINNLLLLSFLKTLRFKISSIYFFSILTFLLLYLPLFPQSTNIPNIDPALEKSKYFYFEGGYANWEPSAVKNFIKTTESSNLNGTSSITNLGKKDRINNFDFSTKARMLSIGVSLPSSNGYHKGNLVFSYISTGSSYLENYLYRQTNLYYGNNYLNTNENGYSYSSLGSVSRRYAQYDHDFYLLPDHPSKYLVGLGLKIGFYVEHDSFSPRTNNLTQIQSSNTILSNSTSITNGIGLPIPIKESYDEVSLSGILGGTYRIATLPNQELEANAMYYSGYGRIYETSSYNNYISNGETLFPVAGTDKYKSRTEIEGTNYSVSYLFKITDFRNLKFFVSERDVNHRTTKIDVVSSPTTYPSLPPYGPYPSVNDKLRMIGFQFQIKF
jgi:hypothetical protein